MQIVTNGLDDMLAFLGEGDIGPGPASNATEELGEVLSDTIAAKLEDLDIPDSFMGADFKFRGENLKFMHDKSPVVVLSGPAESGKSTISLALVHYLCLTHKNLRCVISRAIRVDMTMSVINTLTDKIIYGSGPVRECRIGGKNVTVKILGGSSPTEVHYSTGSIIYFVGMDRGGKVLSSELDIALLNQGEEISEDSVTKLQTRTTGRAGNIQKGPIKGMDVWGLCDEGPRNAQILVDCNPSHAGHWIKTWEADKRLVLYNSLHRDNPALYNDDGSLTEQGKISMTLLESLTGVMRDRYLLGLWNNAEGAYFIPFFSRQVHAVSSYNLLPQEDHVIFGGLDSGFRHYTTFYLSQVGHDGVITTFYERTFRLKRADYIVPSILDDLQESWGLDIKGIKVYAGVDCFAERSESPETIAGQYRKLGMPLTQVESKPGIRAMRAKYFLGLLGNSPKPKDSDSDLPAHELDPPRWYYYDKGVTQLPAVLEWLPIDPSDIDRPLKADLNPDGVGLSDDHYDGLMHCIYSRVDVTGSVSSRNRKKLEKLKKARNG